MNPRLMFTLVLLTADLSRATEPDTRIDLKTLMSAPEKRHHALVSNKIDGNDSTPDIARKRDNYFNALKKIAEELRKTYYRDNKYPKDVFAGIEERAGALVAAKYPLSGVTGCSYVDYLQDSYRVQMAEQTISFMAKAIFERLKDGDVKAIDKSAPTRVEWITQWNNAGKVEDGPNQDLAPLSD